MEARAAAITMVAAVTSGVSLMAGAVGSTMANAAGASVATGAMATVGVSSNRRKEWTV